MLTVGWANRVSWNTLLPVSSPRWLFCSLFVQMNKSLGRDYDWSVANKQATIGRCWIQRRRPGLSAGEPNCRIEQFFAPCAHRLAIGRLFICGLLSKHNFSAFTLRDLSPDEVAEPSVPSQLLKLIFCAAGLDRHRSYDALEGKRETFQKREQKAFLLNLIF